MTTKGSESKGSFHVDMTSTTELTNRKNGPTDDYKLHEHRNHPKSTSYVETLIHLLKGSLGTGVLAMPMAFKNAGLAFGLAATLIIGIVCTHCVHILVKSSHILCRRQRIPSLGFAETAEMAFKSGPPKFQKFSTFGRKFVNGSLLATGYGGVAIYAIFAATNLKQVADYYMDADSPLDIRVYIPMLLVIIIPLCLIKTLKLLVPISTVCNIFMFISFIIVLYYLFDTVPEVSEAKMMANVVQLPLFFGTVIFALEAITMIMPLENNMKEPERFLGWTGVLNVAMYVVVLLYAVIGFFGYLKFGEDIQASVTLNLPVYEIPAQLVRILYGAAMLSMYAFAMYITMDIVWGHFEKRLSKKWQNPAEIAYRIFIVIATVGFGVAVPNLGPIISLIGAVCFSILGLFCPAMIETITLWENGLGRFKWRLWKNMFIAVFAAFGLVTGTYASILDIVSEYTK